MNPEEFKDWIVKHPKSEKYSLENFVVAFNNEEISDTSFIAEVYGNL